MKKTICGLIGATVMAATSVFGADLGDKVPDLNEHQYVGHQVWQDGKHQGTVELYADKQGQPAYTTVSPICDGKKGEPYAYMDLKKGMLYLDNAPTDGVIDGVYTSKEIIESNRRMGNDAPKCIGPGDL